MWLKAVPWGTIIANAPAMVKSARRLIERRSSQSAAGRDALGTGPEALQARVLELEERQRKMAELIESLAESNERMTEALTYLRARASLNFRISILLVVAVISLMLKLVFG
ncbi:MAG: hypothetical protein ACREUQ_14165 [Burkholderiales bacterium]